MVPPHGLRRRIFWSLMFAALTAGLLGWAVSAYWRGPAWGVGLVAAVTLWMASGRLAWRLAWPLNRLADVVNRFGEGDYSARTGFHGRRSDEVGRVAKAVDGMAERIERQMKEERELLAFVSHELRTPMARIRVLTDLARDGQPSALDEIDREVEEVDALVANVLARSRLEFGTLTTQEIRVTDAVGEALSRMSLPAEFLHSTTDARVKADPTLLHRAITNLLDNAQRHGGGVVRVDVSREGDEARIEVLDGGAGFAKTPVDFQAFGRPSAGGLGLGLSLVARIAAAQGGRVWAENRAEGGARVGLALPVYTRNDA